MSVPAFKLSGIKNANFSCISKVPTNCVRSLDKTAVTSPSFLVFPRLKTRALTRSPLSA